MACQRARYIFDSDIVLIAVLIEIFRVTVFLTRLGTTNGAVTTLDETSRFHVGTSSSIFIIAILG